MKDVNDNSEFFKETTSSVQVDALLTLRFIHLFRSPCDPYVMSSPTPALNAMPIDPLHDIYLALAPIS